MRVAIAAAGREERRPARPGYDAIVDLLPRIVADTMAYALVKLTFEIREDRCVPCEPEPLLHDLRDEDAQPRLVPGTDFWPVKQATDFVVRGSAFAPDGQPVEDMLVFVTVDGRRKPVAVLGEREISWNGSGAPRIGPPRPFTEMPLTWENAYGGIDFRVPIPEMSGPGQQVVLEVDHPGLYPRNPFGRGYLVEPSEVLEMTMPTLEDPSDRLTAERLVIRDPRLWYLQPMPWCYDWTHPVMFPRVVFVGGGADAWYPAPEDERLPEVARGLVEPRFRSRVGGSGIFADERHRFLQGASHGFTFRELPERARVKLEGLHPEHPTLEFDLPRRPKLELLLDGKRQRPEPRLHHVVCRPAEERLTMVWGVCAKMPRTFLPGIHKHIPLALRFEGDAPIEYETPVPVREKIEAGRAAQASAGSEEESP